jgi:hypothetical protein
MATSQWIKFVTEAFITFPICRRLTFDKNTQGRIINEPSVKWIWSKKYYFRISIREKLRELIWKEIEEHKFSEEATPTPNELYDTYSLFAMNPIDFDKMINISKYFRNRKRISQSYEINYNTLKLKF